MNASKTKKIIFVCTGNTCRSPMAEAVCRSELKRLRVEGLEVLSAGTAASARGCLNPNSAIVLAENGLALENFNSTLLTDEAVNEAFAVVCMTERQREELTESRAFAFFQTLGKVGSTGENIHSFYSLAGYEIPDPFGRDLDCYRFTFEKISKAIPVILEKLGVAKSVSKPEAQSEAQPERQTPANTEKKDEPPKKKRGRPRKNPLEEGTTAPKKRGRPKKITNQTKN